MFTKSIVPRSPKPPDFGFSNDLTLSRFETLTRLVNQLRDVLQTHNRAKGNNKYSMTNALLSC